jgi:hypothetical protein
MVTTNSIILFILFEHLIASLVIGIIMLIKRRWKIDVTIYRFSGDKRRPITIHRKARYEQNGNAHKLWIKGYKFPIKEFNKEYYYPGEKGAYGSLSLFEFKPGWLTPVLPEMKNLPPELKQQASELFATLRNQGIVNFEFDPAMYDSLMLKAIDDTDAEWQLQQQQRIDITYSGGWKDFFKQNGGWIVLAIIAVCLLVGWIVWIKESPDWLNQCISAGVEAAKNTYLKDIAGNIASGSSNFVPPG